MLSENATNLEQALGWLKNIVDGRLRMHFGEADSFELQPLNFYIENSWLAQFLASHDPSFEEFTVLMLAIVPQIQPGFFSKVIAAHFHEGGDFPEFGGVKATNHRDILPTGETAQFILAGDNIENRLEIQRILGTEHWFSQKHILWLEPVREGEPVMSGRLILDPEIVEQLTVGTVSKPRFSKKKIRPGYRALFYGPSGTGKTLTATLVGKYSGKAVFRIDLSRVVSKYIGETEKNLSRLFDKAENKNWILFFDEADALFGKRTDIRNAHDKYANQEVAYLLQRIESYNGVVILASNQRANIDDAFVRRFQTIIHFPMPRSEERHEIWRKTFPSQVEISIDIDWQLIAARYELAGAGILNVTHYCSVELLASQSNSLNLKLLESAIQRELIKEGKIV
ncbi:ATPase family protein associated with various cellular activities (AAA) [Methylobacter tundripaludum]|uniref:ATPase family protein associated with various cellular activities (AAA) n=1 Tax=Methylobacter tundripaludum TaxID=173365 RepID=A0A2S6H969_9GAMM|nr:ATP-binding protein [Methylobacter tundripaludum]PPK73943.1 ATPase family protein associated with various cellular activities (AAA) [Methylobacter tundripaludum]